MKIKKFLSFVLAVGMASTSFPALNALATKGPELGVYLSHTVLGQGQYMRDTQEVMEGEQTIGENGCVAHFSDTGILSLYGTMTLGEARTGNQWGVIGGTVGASDLTIRLLDGADYTLNSTGYSGIYGNYEPVRVEGNGKITINTSGASEAGIMVYGKDGSENSVPTGVTITDNAEVTITGTKGIVLTGGADGDITVTDGAVLTVDTDSAAFTKAPVIEAGSEVTVGASPEEAEAWDGSTALTSYNYVRIEAPDEGGETTDTPEEPSDIPSEPSETAPAEPTETVTETPSTPDPDLPTENFSRWIGIQPVRDGRIEWLYDGHYMMPDGTHLSTTNDGEPDGTEAVYYDEQTGTVTFSKDITIYGASDASEYRTYYGTGISWQYGVDNVDTNMGIRLENGANVTIDATNRDAFTYLYGIYGNGTLVVTGDGTLTIRANGGTSDNYAMCVYNGKESSGLGNILIKDNVTLDLEAADDNGIGIGVYGAGAGNITIKDNAVLEAYGGTAAINKAPVMPDNASVSVGESAETAEAWDGTFDITQYKYVRINASGEEPQETEPAATESAAPATSAPSETPAASTPSAAPATTAPAETEEPPALPETGVIWQDDYERWATYDWQSQNLAEMRVANGGDYGNIYRMNIGLAEGHGKVLEVTSADSADRGFDWYTDDAIGADDYVEINDGVLRISAQVCIPSGFVMNQEDQEINNYVWTWSEAALEGDAPNDLAYLFKVGVTYGEPRGRISFQTGTPSNLVSADASNSMDIDFDTWYTIDTVINYDAGVIDYYVDGNLVTSYPGAPDDIGRYFPVAYMQLHQNGRFTESDAPLVFLWDNFAVELLDDSFDAEVVESGADHVDVRFTKAVSDSELSNAEVSVRIAGDDGSLAAASGYTRLSADTVRFTFDSLLPATAYELVFGADTESAYGDGTMAAGSMVVFTTPASVTETTLIDMSFDDADGEYWLVHSASSDDLTFVDDEANTSEHVEIRDGVLYYDHYLDVAGQERNGLKFPFADGTTVDSGKITVEFDAGVSGETGRTRAVFGLEDPEKTDTAWTPATVFSGIAPYDGSRLSFTMASESTRNALTGDSGMDITAAITAQEEMHHYKIEIDLDNNSYRLYYDGALAADLDYIPGGNAENSFDAFIMSGVYASSDHAADSDRTFIMLDDLKVTAEHEAASVGSVTFIKYDGTENGYSSVVSAGTKEIRLGFTKEMAEDTAEHISIEGMDASNYEVTFSGSEAVIEFANCLDADTSYVLRIDADVKDADGGAATGEAVYRFTADSGEVEYGKPVITDNGGTVTAEVTVVNTTANDINNFYITLASYNSEGMLTGIIPLEAAYSKAEGYTKTFTVTGDTGAFSEADMLGAFVFSDLTNIRPLTDSTELQR